MRMVTPYGVSGAAPSAGAGSRESSVRESPLEPLADCKKPAPSCMRFTTTDVTDSRYLALHLDSK